MRKHKEQAVKRCRHWQTICRQLSAESPTKITALHHHISLLRRRRQRQKRARKLSSTLCHILLNGSDVTVFDATHHDVE